MQQKVFPVQLYLTSTQSSAMLSLKNVKKKLLFWQNLMTEENSNKTPSKLMVSNIIANKNIMDNNSCCYQ